MRRLFIIVFYIRNKYLLLIIIHRLKYSTPITAILIVVNVILKYLVVRYFSTLSFADEESRYFLIYDVS